MQGGPVRSGAAFAVLAMGPLSILVCVARKQLDVIEAAVEAAHGAQVDLAGACCRRAWRGRIATVAVNQSLFKQPVSVGDLLSLNSRIARVGTTSVTVHMEVLAERNPANLQVVRSPKPASPTWRSTATASRVPFRATEC